MERLSMGIVPAKIARTTTGKILIAGLDPLDFEEPRSDAGA
jgi:hypothetical protein